MIIATTMPTFPGCPTYGFSSSPLYLVKITEREGGYEKRDRKWKEPLHSYSAVPLGPRPQKDIESIAAAYHAMGGPHRAFRFKDWADYKSCILDNDPDPLDMPFEFQAGSPGGYQLIKQYTLDGFTTTRTIRCPKGDTIRVANASGIEQPSSTWTIEEDTGLLVPTGGFAGVPARWGGEFYVPCRFDGALDIEIVNFKIESLRANLKETRPEDG